ncbi:MAG: 4-hydroxybenzoate octaprenyltransferase [Nitrospirae bacterium CG_4_10_14_0_8_um_filter_41_23]|nr:UbiA family prenyltransferase [Nitrospirota bacterium]OIP61368.1 MAG: 4-hydroxybenzoate octaprenyltransferase [Nitrospirae bacterium CG2_30_41_42]PIQ94578.1 MAG: 4-hydroxybenzoate octaprenyltransferase [Nitrospirae bacterium CG11_big_fil_rev_8_21_14_0_20_41_14]PIV41309.1 MAG: 4-hydroxybenzoate octaprenyltransferase [Nitrospirae bacterium CG02_land_8_20_14_3_00_41_53]PIW87696.1 MAG: 4-hydroxybenzoate octaprenyltransferase [Nitrospirae bacterium CG_4_8_14_3_um_filter_41_47]PIY86544.1 MAG: 4-h
MVLNKIRVYLEMIKFQHSIFALPFAYIGAFLSQMKVPSFITIFWITLAMVGARSFAMSLNRLIDIKIDCRNPRTADRALPKKLISIPNVILFTVISLSLFLLSVYNLAPICRYLWPFIVIPFVIYPYTKRFTWLSHFILGLCLGMAPIGAWIAVTNTFSVEPFLIGGAVILWVSGFDILYAIQDIDFDRQHRLFSVPVRFGVKRSLELTSLLHIASIVILTWLGINLSLGLFYFAGLVVTSILLGYEKSLIKPDDLSRLNQAFFTMNGVISVVMFCFVTFEVIFGKVRFV